MPPFSLTLFIQSLSTSCQLVLQNTPCLCVPSPSATVTMLILCQLSLNSHPDDSDRLLLVSHFTLLQPVLQPMARVSFKSPPALNPTETSHLHFGKNSVSLPGLRRHEVICPCLPLWHLLFFCIHHYPWLQRTALGQGPPS